MIYPLLSNFSATYLPVFLFLATLTFPKPPANRFICTFTKDSSDLIVFKFKFSNILVLAFFHFEWIKSKINYWILKIIKKLVIENAENTGSFNFIQFSFKWVSYKISIKKRTEKLTKSAVSKILAYFILIMLIMGCLKSFIILFVFFYLLKKIKITSRLRLLKVHGIYGIYFLIFKT